MAGILLQKKWFLLLSSFILTSFVLLILQNPSNNFNNSIDDQNAKVPLNLWRGLTVNEVCH